MKDGYEKAKRVPIYDIKNANILDIVRKRKEFIVVTEYGKDIIVMLPYSEKIEIQQEYERGNIDYETYRQAMLNIGYQQLQEGKVKVNPGAIVVSERTEIEREKTKIMGNEFLLEAAKYFGGYLKPHICPKCREIMVPKGDERVVNELPEQ